ncbi:MAG: tryptophan-rich sensory protein [Bacteroidetes bacterium]|jgi:benzodiazapine receptor|nr:tryptophan-rich sensory protein [Bacteroidota bacterium]
MNSKQNSWYLSLKKSPFTPPSWVFPIVWTILYAFIIVSGIIFLMNRGKIRSYGFFYYCVAWILNLAWSPFFFKWARPDLSFVIVVAMLIFIALNVREFYAISKLSSYLLIPYLVWVSFATYLNGYIVVFNKI